MKVYNEDGDSMEACKEQMEILTEAGWSRTKPEAKPVVDEEAEAKAKAEEDAKAKEDAKAEEDAKAKAEEDAKVEADAKKLKKVVVKKPKK